MALYRSQPASTPGLSAQSQGGNTSRRPRSVTSLLSVAEGRHREGEFVTVIGVVVDFMAPVPTRGPGKSLDEAQDSMAPADTVQTTRLP